MRSSRSSGVVQPSVKTTDPEPESGVLFMAQVLHGHECLFNLCVGKMVFLLHPIVTAGLLEEVKTAFEWETCLLIQLSVHCLLFMQQYKARKR